MKRKSNNKNIRAKLVEKKFEWFSRNRGTLIIHKNEQKSTLKGHPWEIKQPFLRNSGKSRHTDHFD